MDNLITVKGLTVQINRCPLIKNISFSIGEGEAVLLSGENGIGKSTLLKALLGLETAGKTISGNIFVRDFGDILTLKPEELQRYRASVAYVPQRDDYSSLGNVRVQDIISDSRMAFAGKAMSEAEVNDLIDEWIPRKSNNSRVFEAKAKPAKFSGGEQRLLSVLSIIATRSKANLLIIDEPLNNLDFINARYISNVINRAMKENPQMGLVMISHCRIFPFITREIKLTPDGIQNVPGHYVCHSCFGTPDINGYFN